jgi:hypothetical protein
MATNSLDTRRQQILQTIGSNAYSSDNTINTIQQRRLEVDKIRTSTPVKKVSTTKITTTPTPKAPVDKIVSNIQKTATDVTNNIKGFFTPKGGIKQPIQLPETKPVQLTSQQQNTIGKLKIGDTIPNYKPSAQLKPIQKGQTNLLDEFFVKPTAYLAGKAVNEVKKNAKDAYENPFLSKQINQLDAEVKKNNPKAYQELQKNPIYKASKNIQEFQTETVKGVVQGVVRVYANFHPEVQKFLDTELKNVEKEGDASLAGNTVGQVIGTIGAFVLGGEITSALKFGKLALPITFATLGQTSLPQNTPIEARARNAVIDSVSGALLEYIKPLANIGKMKAGKQVLEYTKQATKGLSILSGQVYLDARSLGASHEEALKMVKDNALIILGLHGFLVTAKAGEIATRSKFKEGKAEFTPQQVKDIVIGSNLEKTQLGNELLKQSVNAEAQNKNLVIDMGFAKQSKVSATLKLDTPKGVRINSIELVEPKTTIGEAPVVEQPATQKPAVIEKPAEAPVTNTRENLSNALINSEEDMINLKDVMPDRVNPFPQKPENAVVTHNVEVPVEQINFGREDISKKRVYRIREATTPIQAEISAVYDHKTDTYTIVDDGNHRLANAIINGDATIKITNVYKPAEAPAVKKPVKENITVPEKQKVEEIKPEEIKRVADNILKNNTDVTKTDAEAMAKDIIRNRSLNETKAKTINVDKIWNKGFNKEWDKKYNEIWKKKILAGEKIPLPVIDKNGGVIDGHHRVEAYIELGYKEIPFQLPKPGMDYSSILAKESKPKEELVMKPSEGSPKTVQKEITQAGLTEDKLKFSTSKNKQEELTGGNKQLAYAKSIITKSDLRTIANSSDEFKKNPILTVTKKEDGSTVLSFKGNKIKFSIKPEALGLNYERIDKLPEGTKIKVDLKSLTGKEQQMRVYKGTTAYASKDKFAELPVMTKKAEDRFQSMNVVEMPELVRIVKDLLGKYPNVKLKLGGNYGMFRPGRFSIDLRADIFKDPQQASKTLAHELGHLMDFLPDKTMARGNLLGRIGSLNKYMGSFLSEFPGGKGEMITPKDRARLQRQAKTLGKSNYEAVTREVEVEKIPVKPDEILAIWNSNTANITNPELLSYIQGLTSAEKREIVVNAMKGNIPKWVTYTKSVKKTITEQVLRDSPKDIRKIYEKLIKEEIIRRRLVSLQEIKKELQILSRTWRPFDPNLAPKSYLDYRNKPTELYADAISVLYNDPVMLQQQAPEFYKAFFNYLERKPDVKETYLNIQETLSKGEDKIFEERRKAVREGYDTAEDKQKAQLVEKLKQRSNVLSFVGNALDVLLNDKNAPVNKRVRAKVKQGVTIDASQNPIYSQASLNYIDGKLKNFVIDNFQKPYKMANEVKDGWETLGEILQMERAINERGEMANPGGYSPETAQAYLDKLEQQFSPADWQKLQEAKDLLRQGVQTTVDLMDKNEFKDPELIAQMKGNKTYATFQVVDYVEQNLTSAVHQQVGTLKDIANPATSTVMKSIVTMKAIEYNNAKKLVLDFQKEQYPDEIEVAKSRYAGKNKGKEFIKPRDPEQELVLVIEGGKLQGYYVPKDLAYVLNNTNDRNLQMLGKVSRMVTATPFYRPLFTTLNLGFQTFNSARDLMRFWRSFPHETLGGVLASPLTDAYRVAHGYTKAFRPVLREVRGKEDPLIREMRESKMLGLTYNDLIGGMNDEDRQIERVLQQTGVLSPNPRQAFAKRMAKPLYKVLDAIETIGNIIERMPKVAGYIELKGSMPEEELAHFIRTRVGSPDFRTSGTLTPSTNNIFMFSNAFKEGYKTDLIMATSKKSRSSWWYKTILTSILPKLFMMALALGLLGKKAKDEMDGVSEYDKANYTVITLGTDENGKTVYIRLPQDEWGRLVGAITWKSLKLLDPDRKKDVISSLMDIFSLGAGQIPTVSPSINGMGATIQYLSGRNPYDNFRNRNIIPDQEFKAGWKYSLPIFLDWLVKQQGGGIVVPSFTPQGDQTELQKFLNLPFLSNIAGRWVKVSDYGKTERNTAIKKEVEQKQAQKSLDVEKKVEDAVKKYQESDRSPESMRKIERDLINSVVPKITSSADKTKRTNTIKKYRIGIIRGKADPQVNALINATSNEAKVELLQSYKKDLGSGYDEFVKDMLRQKVISSNVFSELRRQDRAK